MTPARTILYVDDEEPNRVVFEATFGERFQVATSSSGPEALERLEQGDVAVLVTDQRMPGMPGNELLTEARRRRPEVVRMVITAYDDVEDILAAVNQGLVARYFVKPWKREELEQTLRWGLDAYRAGRDDFTLQLRLLETERLTALGTVTAEILHDLKQPLSYLAANLEWVREMTDVLPGLKGRAGPAPDPAVEERERVFLEDLPEVLDDLHHGVEAISGITRTYRRILQRARPREGDPGVPLLRAVSYAVRIAQRAAKDADVRLVVPSFHELEGWATGSDAASLSRALLNLLENALHAAAAKPGGQVTFSTRLVESEKEVVLVIEDSGPGMDEEAMRHLGNGFYTTKAGGTGLGFAQAKRQIGMAGGQLHVKSAPGEGTRVEIRLPITAVPPSS